VPGPVCYAKAPSQPLPTLTVLADPASLVAGGDVDRRLRTRHPGQDRDPVAGTGRRGGRHQAVVNASMVGPSGWFSSSAATIRGCLRCGRSAEPAAPRLTCRAAWIPELVPATRASSRRWGCSTPISATISCGPASGRAGLPGIQVQASFRSWSGGASSWPDLGRAGVELRGRLTCSRPGSELRVEVPDGAVDVSDGLLRERFHAAHEQFNSYACSPLRRLVNFCA